MLFMLVPNFVHAEYPQLLNGDRNVILCGGHMGYGVYLFRDSIKVVSYSDNGIILEFDTVGVRNANRDDRVIQERYTYR